VYFLTNRNNLVRVLASGMLMPEAGFAGKYYDDLLRLAPGRVPLMASAASPELLSLVTPDPQAFAVMLEVPRASLKDEAFPALMADGSAGKAGWRHPDARMWAPSGALPLADTVTAIHFRTDAERQEFEAREFADARLRTALHRVSPELFAGGEPSADAVTEWLRSLEAAEVPTAEDIVAEDRRAGAILLGCLTSIATEEELIGWGQLLIGRKPGKQAGAVVSRVGRALERAAKARDPEDIVLEICVEELGSTNRLEVWRPLDVLGRIREKLEARLKAKVDPLAPALDRAAAILRDEEVLAGLKSGGSTTLKALLMVLRRPEPQGLLGWDPGGPGSTPEVLNVAGVLLGALTGRAMIPVGLRGEMLDDQIARVEADRLSASRDRAMPAFKARAVDVLETEGHIRLTVEGSPIVERPIPLPSEQPFQIDRTLLAEPAVRTLAIEISVRNGWDDVIESVVETASTELKTSVPQHAGAPVTIRLAGIASIRHELLPDAFIARATRQQLPSEDVDRLRQAQPPLERTP
jgi:hypothetical protein